MDDADRELSKRLHEVLDVIGASEYIREKYWEGAMVHEIVHTFQSLTYSYPSNNVSFYLFGSSCEGTTTQDLDSDFDVIYCADETPVVENLFESNKQGISYLVLRDEDTKPGYVRLQIVENKCPLIFGLCVISEDISFIDRKGRICAKHPTINVRHESYRNGPANRLPAGKFNCQVDEVFALRCRQIPRSAKSWLHRLRKYDWPSQKQLTSMGSYGCLFVGVAHPHSNNKTSEWRMSFSLQERDLMSNLNETQHKCYILLKMIKKDLIESKTGESISSYHCKTSLFYTIENSQRHFWTNDKLILCVQKCLKLLFIWVKAKYCPNYFIPEANMFDKLSVMTLDKIEYVLSDILESGIKCLYSLTCENVGKILKSKLCVDELAFSLTNSHHPKFVVFLCVTKHIYNCRNRFLRLMSMPSNTTISYMNGLMQLLLYLQLTNNVTEHTTRDVRMALDSIIPYIQLQYNQCMFVQYLLQENVSDLGSMTIANIISETSDFNLISETSDFNLISETSDFNLISSKLSLASLYVQCEEYQEECKRILVSCEKEIEPYVISVCSCYDTIIRTNLALDLNMRFTDMSSKDFRRRCITDCMLFHPSQVSLVHAALKYEMFRNAFTKPGSEVVDDWLNWITIDSQIYLYFLQYLLYTKTKQRTEKETAVLKLAGVLVADPNIGHRETGLNLLGWILLQVDKLQVAWKYFCESWKIRPFKNAAKWHMLILLLDVIQREMGFELLLRCVQSRRISRVL